MGQSEGISTWRRLVGGERLGNEERVRSWRGTMDTVHEAVLKEY